MRLVLSWFGRVKFHHMEWIDYRNRTQILFEFKKYYLIECLWRIHW